MNEEMDDVIDMVLRDQFNGPVAADSFCDAVMERLPVLRPRYKWPLAAGVVAGVVLYSLSLWSAPIASTGWNDWLSGSLSMAAITLFVAIAGMAILALLWTSVEADEPDERQSRPLAR